MRYDGDLKDLMIILSILLFIYTMLFVCSGCGSWTDWSDMQASRIPIIGEPVDEEAVRDAVAAVLGESDMHAFAVWFTLEDLPHMRGKVTKGSADLCTRNETIKIHLNHANQCVLDTSLVHELMHRYMRHTMGMPCDSRLLDHPVDLFGKCGDGGVVGLINKKLGEKHCQDWTWIRRTCTEDES